jgi:hypothetical protein
MGAERGLLCGDCSNPPKSDFDVLVMKHMGHHPMLERPYEFNRRVADTVAGLGK